MTDRRPNSETLEALAELDDGGGEVFTSTADLFADWRKPTCLANYTLEDEIKKER